MTDPDLRHLPLLRRAALGALTAALTATMSAQPPPSTPSKGPAVGMPVAVNLRDTGSGAPSLLLYKAPGLAGRAPAAITEPLPGPGNPIFTAEALHWSGQSSWIQCGGQGPAFSVGSSAAYDPVTQRVLVAQAPNGASSLPLWAWDGAGWSLASTSGPTARSDAAMVYDTARGRTLLFGGLGSNGQVTGDTWEWGNNAWTPRAPAVSPSPRSHHAMSYDAARSQVIMYGGGSAPFLANAETWRWNGTTWSQLTPPTNPGPRFDHAMAYDPIRQQIVLFGGSRPLGTGWQFLDDTWRWDGLSWQPASPTNRPSPRGGHAMSFDARRGRILLSGGSATPAPCDLWEWDGSDWTPIPNTPGMADRVNHVMAYDAARGTTVIAGGFGFGMNFRSSETWTQNGPLVTLQINDFSLGLDYIPATLNSAASTMDVSVPPGSWIGMAFSVTSASQGTDGSVLRGESSTNGGGNDVFSYVFAGSDPNCLPSAEIDIVRRAVDSTEGTTPPGTTRDLNAIDVFLPAYNNDPSFAIGALPDTPTIYFTVRREGLPATPNAWWAGTTPSAATILRTTWNPNQRLWSCPTVWVAHDEISVGGAPLANDEEIDALAIGYHYHASPAKRYLAFSTRPTRGGGAPTAAPSQLMVAEVPGTIGTGSLIGFAWFVATPTRTALVERLRLDRNDDVDAICTWDPCGPPGPRETMWGRMFGRSKDPAATFATFGLPFTLIDGSVYRHRAGGVNTLTAVTTGGSRPGFAALLLTPDPFLPLSPIVSLGVFPTPGGATSSVATDLIGLPPGPIPVCLHWIVVDGAFTIFGRASSALGL